MRKDPVTQINLRLDPELARKLKALSAISGRSLNSLITLAIDEYVFLRRATVLEGQKIVDGYANFDATLKPVRSIEEREALQAAQSQELKSAIQTERTAYAQAQATAPEPTSMAGTQGQGVEAATPVHAEAVPSQTLPASGIEQEENQDVPQDASAPMAEAQEPAWVLAARKREALRLEKERLEREQAEEWAADTARLSEEKRAQREAAWAAKAAADTARICQKQDMAQADRMTAQAEEEERRLQREGAISSLYVAPTSASSPQAPAPEREPEDMDQEESQEPEEASQPGNESEGQDASQEEPSHMAGNQDASQAVEAAPVAQKAVKDMSIEEKRARARELKAQGMTYQQIADAMGTNKSTAYHWANK